MEDYLEDVDGGGQQSGDRKDIEDEENNNNGKTGKSDRYCMK